MNIEIKDELIMEGVARAVSQVLHSEQFIERVADAIALRFELLQPQAAADLLGKTARTLADNHVEWGLDKSIAFGATNPLYFLSQITDRAKAKVIKGAQPKGASSA